MQHDWPLLLTDGGKERASIRRYGDALLFGGPKGDLLWRSIGKSLAPGVESAGGAGAEKHPFTIGRPRREGTGTLPRSHLSPDRASIQRSQPAGDPGTVHFHNEDPLAVRRGVGAVRHA